MAGNNARAVTGSRAGALWKQGFAASFLLVSAVAFAQDDVTSRTIVTEPMAKQGYLGREVLGIKPQLGTIVFTDSLGDTTSRAAGGISAEVNFLGGSASQNYFGFSTGWIFSHLGSTGSDFFGGSAPSGSSSAGANLMVVPLDLKVGHLFSGGNVRLSLRGGGNAIYRSVTASTELSSGDAAVVGSDWTIYPNAGIDLEVGALLIRPDWTFAPGDDIFTGTVGLIIPLG